VPRGRTSLTSHGAKRARPCISISRLLASIGSVARPGSITPGTRRSTLLRGASRRPSSLTVRAVLRSIATDSFGAPLVPADCGSGSDRRHRQHDQEQNARGGPMRAHGFILARRDLDRESRREIKRWRWAGAARLRLPKTVAEGPAPRKPRARPGPPPRASSASSTAGPAAVRSG
jgi:hypothetical protein